MRSTRSGIVNLVLAHIVPSFFFGMLVLIPLAGDMGGTASDQSLRTLLLAGTFTGLLTAVVTALFHHFIVNRLSPAGEFLDRAHLRRDRLLAFATSAACGGSTVFLLVSMEGVLVLTVLLLAVILRHIRRFARTIRTLIRPGTLPTGADVWRFAEIYVNVVAGFTLLNAGLNLLHRYGLLSETQFPFGEGSAMLVDSLYFSVVTMTTLGFGDITPLTPLAKVLTVFECLTGYVMFALAVGMVTRGVVSADEEI
ncbi:potassium channel family protein [Salidesulfovibrio brasiliensis]|uniref:potassium channel family protein n=1 Tax=Salidesulfovibrio brasiliensis TaxID=221711 RepID=UPI0006D1E99F|nr:potassium channel family protein [Salidesulfovibrio brasiliensis]